MKREDEDEWSGEFGFRFQVGLIATALLLVPFIIPVQIASWWYDRYGQYRQAKKIGRK